LSIICSGNKTKQEQPRQYIEKTLKKSENNCTQSKWL